MENNLKDGKGKFYYNNEPWKDDKYEGEWKNDQREGKGVYYFNNENKYEGDWKMGYK